MIKSDEQKEKKRRLQKYRSNAEKIERQKDPASQTGMADGGFPGDESTVNPTQSAEMVAAHTDSVRSPSRSFAHHSKFLKGRNVNFEG